MQEESRQGHNLNVSVFERLVSERFPFAALQQQHRMRPTISAPVRALMYPNLTDGPGTHNRPAVRGLGGRNVLMVTHAWPEGREAGAGHATVNSMSKVNVKEADMAVAILKYILQQGYKASEIVMLAAYLGQVTLLRQMMQREQVQAFVGERDEEALDAAGLLNPDVRSRVVFVSAKGPRPLSLRVW